MIQMILFLMLALLSILALFWIIIAWICWIKNKLAKKPYEKQAGQLKKAGLLMGVTFMLNLGLITFTQYTTSTPAILDQDGKILKNSIAQLKQIELNGTKQWITIRGQNKNNPVLLFLAGGPGGSQLAAVRHEMAELEKHFVVVGWDQPGAGKSYYAGKPKERTVETYIRDGVALTQYLQETFDKEKIFLVGESWGSALGIFLTQRYPDGYHGFIGTAQMVAFLETEKIDYEKAIKVAKEKKDTVTLKKLEKNGQPPYYGKDVTWKSAVYLNYLSASMAQNPNIHNPGYNTLRDLFSKEYGILDKINYFRGVINTFNHVYPQLYDVDLRTDYTKIQVPVFFFIGRHDINAPTSLAEEYLAVLEAPQKELIWFEHSGHSPWINERDKFAQELIKRFSQ